ncbi:cation:H+ antiporter [Clostridium collagenovorans DSM 3089]|uniref:Cation:H+ antiporter n=1 Tax=Clostridium collagenovorans DSM 3089 TaxID=1121306 RepID=A0A1M5X498_9CLOT|nr:calcium/sodium antiporter [Clostridium collagenovorans]SHH94637.1 cation:H+ antiporter [Clostridium collagenovorans DSM 3089]
MNYILLIVGFVLLIKGADFFVDGAAAIAKKMGIPAMVVGLTIVSLGTSAPELAISTISSIQGNNGIAIGNVLGSNIFNTLVVLGVSSILAPLIIKKAPVVKDFAVNLIITLILFVMAFDGLLGAGEDIISRGDGIILLILCISYMAYIVISARNNPEVCVDEEAANIKVLPKVIISIVGVAGIVFGGQIVVDSAKEIALSLGMSEKLVGLTIVAIGTSLPELVTSVVAVLKKENDIALGNVLGSNTFNILLILGVSSGINPIAVSPSLAMDFIFLIGITLLMIGIIFFNRKSQEKVLSKKEGILFVALYIAYTVYIIMRN